VGGPTSLEKDSVLGRIQRPTTPSNLNGLPRASHSASPGFLIEVPVGF